MATEEATLTRDEAPSLFVRQSTGLVRELGPLDVILYNSGAVVIGPVLVFVMAYWYGSFPDANVIAALWISLVPIIFLYIVYAFLTAAMPRAGGDYVFIGRILHPALGFAANWTMVVWNVIAFGVWGTYTITLGIAPGLASIGMVTGNEALISAAETSASEPIAAFISRTILILILAVLLTRGLRVTKIWWNTAVVIGLFGLIVGLFPLLLTSQAEFAAAFDGVAGAGAYESVLAYGTGAGVIPLPAVALGATLLAVAMAGSGISGATWSTYTAGEVKQGRSVTRELLVMESPRAHAHLLDDHPAAGRLCRRSRLRRLDQRSLRRP